MRPARSVVLLTAALAVATVGAAVVVLASSPAATGPSSGGGRTWRRVNERQPPTPKTDEEFERAAEQATDFYDSSLDDYSEDPEGLEVATGDESLMGDTGSDTSPPTAP